MRSLKACDSVNRTVNESSSPDALECIINIMFLHQLSFEFTFSLSLSVCLCMSVCVHECMCEHCNYLSLFNLFGLSQTRREQKG